MNKEDKLYVLKFYKMLSVSEQYYEIASKLRNIENDVYGGTSPSSDQDYISLISSGIKFSNEQLKYILYVLEDIKLYDDRIHRGSKFLKNQIRDIKINLLIE